MTERVCYTSDATDGRVQIITCTVEADGRCVIKLDQTLFHPQEGGQPTGRGWITRQVIGTVIVRSDSMLHILSQSLPLGDVEMKIDASTRQLHTRLHSAGHLPGLAGEQLGWQPVEAHHQPGEGRITFTNRNNVVLPDTSAPLVPVKTWRAQDLPHQATFVDGLCQVGFDGLPAYPCGGTHVARPAELGDIVISWMRMRKEQLIVNHILA